MTGPLDIVAVGLGAFLQQVSSGGDLFWPYIVGFIVAGGAVWFVRPATRGRTSIDLARFLFPPTVYRTASAQLDLRYFLVNVLLYSLLVAPFLLTSVAIGRAIIMGLVRTFGVPQMTLPSGLPATIFAAFVLMLAADLGFFISHTLHHRVPALWAFHKVHHSAESLHPLTTFRSHPVNLAIDFTFVAGMTGLASALLTYAFDAGLTPATLLGVNAFNFAFLLAGSYLRHSHIWLDYGPLDSILVSPAMHQLHHSTAERHLNRNMGGILSVWDRMFGTLYAPHGREAFEVGLAEGENGAYRSVIDLYAQPFVEIGRRFFGPTVGRFEHVVAAERKPDTAIAPETPE